MGRARKASTPEAIALRAAQRRAVERDAGRQPVNWGIDPDNLNLPAYRGVTAVVGSRGRVVRAARAGDAFTALGLDFLAMRFIADVSQAAGVNPNDTLKVGLVDGAAASDGVTGAMVEAGRRLAEVQKLIGPASWRLLNALVVPMATRGEAVAWRAVVQQLTGETDRHAQGARVRAACEDLNEAYDLADRARAIAAPRRPVGDTPARRRGAGDAVKGRAYGR